MSERSAMFLVVMGILMTAFGCGGIEQSMDDAGLLTGVLVSVVGLMVMGCGVLGIQQLEREGKL